MHTGLTLQWSQCNLKKRRAPCGSLQLCLPHNCRGLSTPVAWKIISEIICVEWDVKLCVLGLGFPWCMTMKLKSSLLTTCTCLWEWHGNDLCSTVYLWWFLSNKLRSFSHWLPCFVCLYKVIPDVKVVSNLPALSVEETIPSAVSDATLLAPQEVEVGYGYLCISFHLLLRLLQSD